MNIPKDIIYFMFLLRSIIKGIKFYFYKDLSNWCMDTIYSDNKIKQSHNIVFPWQTIKYSPRREVWAHKTSLTLQLFIEVFVPIQQCERSCICVLAPLTLLLLILIFEFEISPRVCYALLCILAPYFLLQIIITYVLQRTTSDTFCCRYS